MGKFEPYNLLFVSEDHRSGFYAQAFGPTWERPRSPAGAHSLSFLLPVIYMLHRRLPCWLPVIRINPSANQSGGRFASHATWRRQFTRTTKRAHSARELARARACARPHSQNAHAPARDGVRAAHQIWDIGGQSIGSKMLSNYIFGSQARRAAIGGGGAQAEGGRGGRVTVIET